MFSKSLDDAPTSRNLADDLPTHPQTGSKILAEVEYGDKIDYLIEGSKPSMKGRLVKKHQYENPGTHDPNGGIKPYNQEKSVLPDNHIELFEQSKPFIIENNKILRFTKDANGIIHRFEPSLDNIYHYSGSSYGRTLKGKVKKLKPEDIPIEIRRGSK